MLPLCGMNPWTSEAFWIGLIFCTLPLNLLVYGWNDVADYEIDKFNPRKGNYLFGALSSAKQIEKLPYYIIAVFLFSFLLVIIYSPSSILIWLFFMLIINWLYNKRKNGLRTRPPLELMSQVGYLLIVPFSMDINGIDFIQPAMWLYLFLFAMQSHLMGEVMDIDSDRSSGRKTTATVLGMFRTKLLIMLLVLFEILIMFFAFGEIVFGGFLIFVLIWLMLDAFLIFKSNRYSIVQMKVFSVASNLIAIATMVYVYFNGDKFF